MMRYRILSLLIGLALVRPHPLSAQVIETRKKSLMDQWIFDIAPFLALPNGDFRKDEKVGGGVDFAVGFQPWRRQPLALRANFGGLAYDGFDNDQDQEVCDFFGNNCQNETVFYNSRHHYMSFVQFGPEFFATDGVWRPYGFAMGGWTFFNSTAHYGNATSTSSNSQSLFSSQNVSSTYGVGVRLVGKNFGREDGWDFGVRFVRNAKARYLTDRGVYRRADGTYDVSPKSGAANVLLIRIGYNSGPHVNWDERRR